MPLYPLIQSVIDEWRSSRLRNILYINQYARPKFQASVDAGSKYLPKNTSSNANIAHQEEHNENLLIATSAATPTESTGNWLL